METKSRYKKFGGSPSDFTKLHVVMKKIIPRPNKCSLCKIDSPRLELANKSQKYSTSVSDWFYLCGSCHKKYDSLNYVWDGQWIKKCTVCMRWLSSVEHFYQRKGKLTIGGKTYTRNDPTSWCKECSYDKLAPTK